MEMRVLFFTAKKMRTLSLDIEIVSALGKPATPAETVAALRII
jgi:hypothetical protein